MKLLSPSQEIAEKEIETKINLIARRIIFLVGKRGVGKTVLMHQMAKKHGKYFSIIKLSEDGILEEDLVELIFRLTKNENKASWIFIDELDPYLYKLKLEKKLEQNFIRILRSYFRKNIIISSTFLLYEFYNVDNLELKRDIFMNLINKDNVVLLEFSNVDTEFLFNNIRAMDINNKNIKNFYEV